MRITFDPVKDAWNIEERDLPFERVAELDWDASLVIEDLRENYGESRFAVYAKLGDRLHVAIVTFRNGATHVISFRKANKREIRFYDRRRGG